MPSNRAPQSGAFRPMRPNFSLDSNRAFALSSPSSVASQGKKNRTAQNFIAISGPEKQADVHNLKTFPTRGTHTDSHPGRERRITSTVVTKERRQDGYFPESIDFAERAEKARMEMQIRPEALQQEQFCKAAEAWLKHKSFSVGRAHYVSQRSASDLKQYIAALNRMFERVKLSDIHAGYIREYQAARAAGELGPPAKDGEPFAVREVGPNKINQEVGTLIRILKYAQCWTPEHEELYTPLQREESDIPHALTPEEQQRWLTAASSNPKWAFVYWYSLLGLDCPMSTNEQRGLKIGDLDLNNNVLMVRVKNSKNKYRTRTIPFSDVARWAIDRLLERARNAGATAPHQCLMPFRNKHRWFPDRPMTVSGIRRPWAEVRKAAGLEWFTPYGLRHTSNTRYAEAGTPIAVLMSLAGHMTEKMQMHYTHISEQAKRKAVQSVSVSQWRHNVSC